MWHFIFPAVKVIGATANLPQYMLNFLVTKKRSGELRNGYRGEREKERAY
jgi:hypothetical protein